MIGKAAISARGFCPAEKPSCGLAKKRIGSLRSGCERIEGALIVQLELPIETVEAAVGRATGFVCANLAPARPVSELLLRRADLIVVNEIEAAYYGDSLHRGGGRVVVTKGAKGAAMYQRGVEMAWATPPAQQSRC